MPGHRSMGASSTEEYGSTFDDAFARDGSPPGLPPGPLRATMRTGILDKSARTPSAHCGSSGCLPAPVVGSSRPARASAVQRRASAAVGFAQGAAGSGRLFLLLRARGAFEHGPARVCRPDSGRARTVGTSGPCHRRPSVGLPPTSPVLDPGISCVCWTRDGVRAVACR